MLAAAAEQFKDWLKDDYGSMRDWVELSVILEGWYLVQDMFRCVAFAAVVVWYSGVAGGQDPGGQCTAGGHGATGCCGVPGAPGVLWTMLLAIAAKLMLCSMKMCRNHEEQTMECLRKLVYNSNQMEYILRYTAGSQEEIIRTVGKEMKEYDGHLPLVDSLRDHCSAWARANHVDSNLEMRLWRLTCTEVQLRWCRDVVQRFLEYEALGEPIPVGVQIDWRRAAANMQLQVECWSPLSWVQWGTEVQGQLQDWAPVLQQVLVNQLKERAMELGGLAAHHQQLVQKITACVGRLPALAVGLMNAGTAAGRVAAGAAAGPP